MKFKEINRQRYLSNTPAKKWITVAAVTTTVLSAAYTVYFYQYKADEYVEKLNNYSKNFGNDFVIKQQDKLNKPLQKTAYRNYLKEKKAYEAQLNKETQLRLERIKAASLGIPVEKTKAEIPQETKPVYSKRSIVLNYLTLGYWPVRIKSQKLQDPSLSD